MSDSMPDDLEQAIVVLEPAHLSGLTRAKKIATRSEGIRGIDYGYSYRGGNGIDQSCIRFRTWETCASCKPRPLRDM